MNKTLTWVCQKWRLSAPQTLLRLIKVWFTASTFVVKIDTFTSQQTIVWKINIIKRKSLTNQ